MNGDNAKAIALDKLDIFYDPETDTLEIGKIGNGHPACYGEDVAQNLTAHTTEEGEVLFFVLSDASEVLFPYLYETMQAKAKEMGESA